MKMGGLSSVNQTPLNTEVDENWYSFILKTRYLNEIFYTPLVKLWYFIKHVFIDYKS